MTLQNTATTCMYLSFLGDDKVGAKLLQAQRPFFCVLVSLKIKTGARSARARIVQQNQL
jgi:hypothetical protein